MLLPPAHGREELVVWVEYLKMLMLLPPAHGREERGRTAAVTCRKGLLPPAHGREEQVPVCRDISFACIQSN